MYIVLLQFALMLTGTILLLSLDGEEEVSHGIDCTMKDPYSLHIPLHRMLMALLSSIMPYLEIYEQVVSCAYSGC